MAKSKVATGKVRNDAQVKAISSVKGGAITKPSQTPKSKSKEVAKHAAAKADIAAKGDKKSKKFKKEPTPESSTSESESDATSASSASSEDESESEAEISKPAAKSSETKLNGTRADVKPEAESSDSSASSDDEEEAKPVKKSIPTATKNGAAQHSSESEEESDVSSERSDDSAVAAPGGVDSSKFAFGKVCNIAFYQLGLIAKSYFPRQHQ